VWAGTREGEKEKDRRRLDCDSRWRGTEEGGKGLEGRKDGKDGEKGKGWGEISPPPTVILKNS